ncbi:Transposase [Nostoc flagelliforme CCNUN1]|uniref:Transposase n=1 Tax=Nostoc flagelliforme CCNUN1 TaxID=2038116 RepID=A0A2K8SNS5_9NOSO|nr:Transposase [Nostoc flagelliforme CCNUN1]
MLHKVVQVRLYPLVEQEIQLAQTFGCARWWWNYALNKSIETYKETGKGEHPIFAKTSNSKLTIEIGAAKL